MDVEKTKVMIILVQPSTVQIMTYQQNLKNTEYLKIYT